MAAPHLLTFVVNVHLFTSSSVTNWNTRTIRRQIDAASEEDAFSILAEAFPNAARFEVLNSWQAGNV